MKKIILILVVFFLFNQNVSASTLNREFIDNVWSFHYRNNKVWTYGQLNIKHIDGKIGYCIEPDSAVNTNEYIPYDDWSISTFDENAKKQMELYAYYGYQYKGHNNIKYYMAAQELIWLFSLDERILWTKEDHSDSEKIDVEKEKQEIINLVNNHNKLPSFANKEIKGKVGETIILKDENSTLNSYKLDNKDISNNQVTITVSKNPVTYNFKQSNNLYDKTVVYAANIRSQRVATFKNPNLNSFSIKVSPELIPFEITKKDKDTKEEIKTSGNKIRLSKIDDDIVYEEEFKDGKISLNLLPGKYMIEELSASKNYMLNTECTYFDVDYDKDNKLDYYNEKMKGVIKIKKVDSENNLLSDSIFNIYDIDNNIVDTIKTTKNEYDISKPIPVGIYYIKEVKSTYGYDINKNIYKANLKYIDGKTKPVDNITIINSKTECEITVISKNVNNEKINFNYNIYDKNNNLVYSGNEEKIHLEYGEYYIVQTKVENGYKLSDEKINFTVNDKMCLVSLTFENKSINMPITSTKSIGFVSFLIILFDMILFNYVKKNN